MTDKEFDILDELYFVKTYADLQKQLSDSDMDLSRELHNLYKKGWIRVLDEEDNELPEEGIIFEDNKTIYKFIATKKGLIAHNQV